MLASLVRFEGDQVLGIRLRIVIGDKDLGVAHVVNCLVIEVSPVANIRRGMVFLALAVRRGAPFLSFVEIWTAMNQRMLLVPSFTLFCFADAIFFKAHLIKNETLPSAVENFWLTQAFIRLLPRQHLIRCHSHCIHITFL